MTLSRAKGAKGKCDVLFSKIVRSRGACEWCGQSEYRKLETSHLVPRSYSWTRTELDNADCLCGSCHRKWHQVSVLAAPVELRARTLERLERNYVRAQAGIRLKFDWEEELERLTPIWKHIEAFA